MLQEKNKTLDLIKIVENCSPLKDDSPLKVDSPLKDDSPLKSEIDGKINNF